MAYSSSFLRPFYYIDDLPQKLANVVEHLQNICKKTLPIGGGTKDFGKCRCIMDCAIHNFQHDFIGSSPKSRFAFPLSNAYNKNAKAICFARISNHAGKSIAPLRPFKEMLRHGISIGL